ncbi:MAG: TolC family protein [Tenacibaculum sp.]
MKIKHITTYIFMLFVFKVQAQDLQILIDEALYNNPQIQRFEATYKRIYERKEEAKTFPNTEISLGVFASAPETRTGAQRFKLSAKQMIPWFGVISARETYIESLAESSYQDIVIIKRKLIVLISKQYYKLYENKAKQRVLDKNSELLSIYKKLALNSVEVDKASAVDVLRLQIRQNEIIQQKEVLQKQFTAHQATLNKLLNRSATISVSVPNELALPLKEQQISAENLKIHPELIKYDKLYTSVKKSELLNKKEENPLIGLRLDYINVEKRPNLSFNDNGKDVIMPTIALSIPIFNKKHSSISKQNKLRLKEISAQKLERLNALEANLQNALANRSASMINYKIQHKNLKQAKNAEKMLLKSYETGTIDFNDVLDIQELQLKFQLSMITSVVNYYIQSIVINYLIDYN